MIRTFAARRALQPSARCMTAACLAASSLAAFPAPSYPAVAQQMRLCATQQLPNMNVPHFRERRAAAAAASPVAAPAQSTTTTATTTATTDAANTEVWSQAEVLSVQKTHRPPSGVVDLAALGAIRFVRLAFDVVSGYRFGTLTKVKVLRRVVFLETLAGIPGMVAGALRHLKSLRRIERDYGWIESLFEEAENERTHMLVFVKQYRPSIFFRGAVLLGQGIFWNAFFVLYMLSPHFCHRFVGYLEEEAVRTYTHVILAMEGKASDQNRVHPELIAWGKSAAPEIAIHYWRLKPQATMLDVMYAVRADEATHRDVNHGFADLKPNQPNPFPHHKYAEDIEK